MTALGVEAEYEDNLHQVFEITDYTTASPLEKFIDEVEKTIRRWQVSLFDNVTTPRTLKHELTLSGRTYELVYSEVPSKGGSALYPELTRQLEASEASVQVTAALLSNDLDFASNLHPIHARFGLKRFVLCQPVISKYSTKVSQSEAKLLLSCLTIAIQHTDSQLPVFAQDGDVKHGTYLGHFAAVPCRVEFTSTALPKPPKAYRHVAGLVTLFKSKLPEVDDSLKAIISARFTYTLRNWFSAWKPSLQNRLLHPSSGQSRYEGGLQLVVGSLSDSIVALKLMTAWPRFKEQTLVDNAVYSDLSPLSAPEWSLGYDEEEHRGVGHLERLLSRMLSQHERHEQYRDVVGEEAFQDVEERPKDGKKAFEVLTGRAEAVGLGDDLVENVRRVGRVGRQLRKKLGSVMEQTVERTVKTVTQRSGDENVSDSDLDAILSALFVKPDLPAIVTEPTVGFGAPIHSLTHRLAQYLACLDQYNGGTKGVAVFWAEMVLELRWHWENLKLMPLGDEAMPDLKWTLFHQKLQFLNYCIQRQSNVNDQRSGTRKAASTEDVFHLCPEDDEGVRQRLEKVKLEAKQNPSRTASSADREVVEPLGVKEVHATLKRLDGSPLNVPITQDPGPMTEDMLKAKEMELLAMGESEDAVATRAQDQSLSLRSDMQAFKAANPGCELPDFVRWHSPRDWIVKEGQDSTEGTLSSRFEGEDNLWVKLWSSTRAVPAARQKQLFDCTRQAEETLQFFETMTIADLNVQLLPCVLNEAVYLVQELAKEHRSSAFQTQVEAFAHGCSTLRQDSDVDQWEDCIRQLGYIEHLHSKLLALRDKLGDDKALLESLLTNKSAAIHDNAFRPRILQVFQPEDEDMRPETQEFVLRTVASAPRASSRRLSHRMYAHVADERFIINGAFGSETALTLT
eukprot:m.214179 g.214179  ORF g.214179 m.214179 type:complete len:908 (-) comp17187_c0_seq1:1585-4308(-)